MRLRSLIFPAACAILLAAPVLAQSPSAKTKPAALRRAADGHPDMQGVWSFAMLTPLERPDAFAGKAVLTDAEAAQAAKEKLEGQYCIDHPSPACNTDSVRPQRGTDGDVSQAYNEAWFERGKMRKETSLIIDPKDGKLPALTALGKERAADQAAKRNRPAWGPEDRSLGERCILGFNAGPPFLPSAYNNNLQIFQTKDNFVVLNEMVHNARIFPINAGAHGTVRQWVGDSRAHWEGDTLVVDTINFTNAGTAVPRIPVDQNLHLIERFTMSDANTLVYEFTLEDPTILTKPFTASVPMSRTSNPLYEYACHEGNYGMFGILTGARAEENGGANARTGSR